MIQGIIESLLLVKESQPPHFIDPDIAENTMMINLQKFQFILILSNNTIRQIHIYPNQD